MSSRKDRRDIDNLLYRWWEEDGKWLYLLSAPNLRPGARRSHTALVRLLSALIGTNRWLYGDDDNRRY